MKTLPRAVIGSSWLEICPFAYRLSGGSKNFEPGDQLGGYIDAFGFSL